MKKFLAPLAALALLATSVTAAPPGGTNPTGGTAVTYPIAVSKGGTGTASPSGYPLFNGASLPTFSSTIPGSAVSGNITGNAASLTGVLPTSLGGTGTVSPTGYPLFAGSSSPSFSPTIPLASISGAGADAALGVGTGLASASSLLSVTYGTAASTAAQGNDSRIVGAIQGTATPGGDLANTYTTPWVKFAGGGTGIVNELAITGGATGTGVTLAPGAPSGITPDANATMTVKSNGTANLVLQGPVGSLIAYKDGFGNPNYVFQNAAGQPLLLVNGASYGSNSTYWSLANAAINGVPAMGVLGNGAVAGQVITPTIFTKGIEGTVGTVIASAATIAPTTPIVHISGTAAITTITPLPGMSAAGTATPCTGGSITLIADGAWSTTNTGGNIGSAMTAVANTPYVATWDCTSWKIK